jgi:D-glycero-D-manno-heptose 1,7-bisphosphate phosphatase
MVGDKPEDLRFGINAGLAAAVLVLTGKGVKSAEKLGLDAEAVARAGFLPVPAENVPSEWLEGRESPVLLFAAADVASAVEGLLAL